MTYFPTRIGNPTQYDDKWHLTVGEPIQGSQITIDLPGDLFSLTQTTQTYDAITSNAKLANQPDATSLVPVVDDTIVETLELVTIQRAMWIPNRYAALYLDEQLTPTNIWRRIYPALLANGHATACKPLIRFH